MKKKSIFWVFALILSIVVAVTLFGCDGNKLHAPDVEVIGNVAVWDEQEGATYEIYLSNELYGETGDNFYIFENLDSETEFTVAAKKDKAVSERSAFSVSKTGNFSSEETMIDELEDGVVYNVPRGIKFLRISGKGEGVSFLVNDRLDDLVVELDNVDISSESYRNAFATYGENIDLNYSVVMRVVGENHISCSFGVSEEVYIPEIDSKDKGVKGSRGGHAIVLPKVAFEGDGVLYLQGGNGGKGGQGADSSSWSLSVYGDGGDGGNGGSGLVCAGCAVAMQNGMVICYGGEGGEGGNPGANGSVLTGPFHTADWEEKRGAKGERGASTVGGIIELSGRIVTR